ncbi:uncharacterized protein LOC119608487 [Lucilia sericata]|uniref:uncharacterized protein LOC119608487 n=1 Tax=Lucilia sericata TaxID=13632 RepID=UPI0018A81A4A|nr:uncharacterized protein LOC119608487 [Lucilia sericata]
MHKIWHKPLHTRKVWKRMTLLNKTIYYLQPFALHLMYTWLQPLPFPTIFKLAYSCILIILMLMPVLVPVLIMLGYYAIVQYLVESALGINYPRNLDIIHYLTQLFKFRIENAKYVEFLNLYMERWRYIAAALASCIDYMRLVLSIVMS